MSCPFKINSNTIELTVHTFCYWVLDLLCVIIFIYCLTLLIFNFNTRMKAFVVLMLVLPIVMSENCPDPRDVPVIDERTQKYTAALVYQVLTGLFFDIGVIVYPLSTLTL